MSRPLRGMATLGLALIAAAAACGGASEPESLEGRRSASEGEPEGDPAESISTDSVRAYLRQLAPYLVSRELQVAELQAIEAERFRAITPILTAWTKEEAFARAARRMVSQKLYVSGTRDDIDFDLPGNLAEHIVREDLPVSTLLTADYCVDLEGKKRECDTGAPFTAGVLATRAYLVSRTSRFNLTRAGTMLGAFACQGYPMPADLQPRIPAEKLIRMFESDTETDEEGNPKQTFGNGAACYACHGQFGPHAQLFVRFDSSGVYRPDATGLQDPQGELGRSVDGLYTSHLKEPDEAKEEKSQVFGRAVENLRDAAKVLAESPTFVPCQVRNLLEYALRVGTTVPVAADVLAEIATSASANGDPTFATLVIETFGHPRIVHAVAPAVGGTR
jgi:hypothetical protein